MVRNVSFMSIELFMSMEMLSMMASCPTYHCDFKVCRVSDNVLFKTMELIVASQPLVSDHKILSTKASTCTIC